MQELGLTLSVEVPEPFAEQVQARLNELHARSASAGSKAD